MTALTSRAVRPRTVPVRALAGVGTAVVALALCAAGCVLLVRNVTVGAPSEEGLGYWLMLVVGAVAYAVVGGWLVVRRAAGQLGPLFLFVALSQATTLFTREYGIHGLQVGDRLPGDRWVFWTSTWTWVPGVLSVVLMLPLLMPDGAVFSPRWRLALGVTAVTIVLATLGWAVTPYDQFDGPALGAAIGPSPVVIPVTAATVIDVVGWSLLLVSAVLVVAALVVRWHHTDADRRRAMAWVLYGVALSITFEAAAMLIAVPAFAAVSIVALPVCCLVAVTRHRLWDLQLVVRRSLLYGGLTAVVATAYAGVVGLVGGAVGAGSGAPIVATAIVAMLVLPLHHVLRRVVNRIVYGQAEDPYVTTTRLGRRLGSAITADQLVSVVLPEILDGVGQALSLRHLSVVMADGRAFAHGADAPDPVELPLRHAGQHVGTLRAVPAHGGLTRSEYRALEDVAAQAAVAVHGVLLAGELQRERERVVVAREEERRRLRRELHDGVGTAIAAASLTAEAARDLMAEHPDQGLALLTRLGDQLRDAVLDVRAVTRDLRPAMLDELGLAGALRELGARSATGDRPVDVEVGDLGEVPAAVEVAAYLVVAELVTNACRHSRASRVHVDVHRDDAELSVRVSDDGRGIAPDAVAGVGLGSVRRRVEELGGHVGPCPGPGTSIEARLPLESR